MISKASKVNSSKRNGRINMEYQNLTIECEAVINQGAVKQGDHAPHIKMTLEDVRIDNLLIQLVKNLDIETILDYFPDDLIKSYAEGIK